METDEELEAYYRDQENDSRTDIEKLSDYNNEYVEPEKKADPPKNNDPGLWGWFFIALIVFFLVKGCLKSDSQRSIDDAEELIHAR